MDSAILTEIGSFLLLLSAGAVGRKQGFFTGGMVDSMNRLMVNLCVPCLMVHSMAESSLPPERDFLLRLLAVTLASFALTLPLGLLGARLISGDRMERRFFAILMTVCNTGNIGNPIARMLFGELGAVYSAFFSLISMAVLWAAGAWLMTGSRQKPGLRQFCTPIMLAVVLGLVLFLFRVRLPAVAAHTMGKLGNMTGPLAMLIVGCELAGQGLKGLLDPALGRCLLVKQLLLPLGLLAALRLMFGGIPEVSVALVLMFMPTAVNVVAFSHDWRLDGKLAASAVLSSTLGSLVLLPALLLVLRY